MAENANATTPEDPNVVTLTFDLNDALVRGMIVKGHDDDGQAYYGPPESVEDALIGMAAHLLAMRVSSEELRTIHKKVGEQVAVIVREKVGERIETALAAPITRTDAYGNPKGDTTTLAEIVAAEATAWLSRPTGDSYSSSQRKTNLAKILDECIGRVWQAEIGTQIAEAKAQVIKTLTASTAQVLTDAVRRGLAS